MSRSYLNKKDEQLFLESLDNSIAYLLGNRDFFKFEELKEEISNSITNLITLKSDNQKRPGFVEYNNDGTTKVNIVSTSSNIYDEVLKHIYAHETSHSVISYINHKFNSEEVRKDEFYGDLALVVNYNGMLEINTFLDAKSYTAGNIFLELFVDFFAVIRTYGMNADKIILGEKKLSQKFPTDYQILFPILKMMIVAFQNSVNIGINDNISNQSGLCESNNIFIKGIIENPLLIYDEWNRIIGKNDYLDFAYFSDLFFHEFLATGKLNKDSLIEIENSIKNFATKRYNELLNNKVITIDEYKGLNKLFNKIDKEFKNNFFGLKIELARKSQIFMQNIYAKTLKKKGE